MLVDFGKAGPIEKARQQPDKVNMVLDKVRTDGLKPTIDAVRNKLDQPLAMGYCNVGVVAECGAGVAGYDIGDRVASNGKHAEMVNVPLNLCARIPDNVSDEEAAFTVIGAIGLQGIRLAQPTLGEVVVVTGLGLIGLLTVQLLRAHGCRVLGIDMDPTKLELARSFGAATVNLAAGEDPVSIADGFSRGRGVDAVIVTAATKSSEPMHQAALMCRKRGRIVLVGVTGLELSRADFFQKELSFQVSCSYGPGRYDPAYEEAGHDYPVGYVRWTEQRNFEAVLDMMASGALDVKPLVSHRFTLERAVEAYEIVAGSEPSLGIILEYPSTDVQSDATVRGTHVRLNSSVVTSPIDAPGVAFIGAGNYSTAVLIPAFKAAGARLTSVASSAGVSGVHAGKKFGFAETTTDTASLFTDPLVQAVVITTRHDTHAQFVLAAAAAGKHAFVEKPLAISNASLQQIEEAYTSVNPAPILMVGFNRRFAPHTQKMRELLGSVREPKVLIMTVNAGAIPSEHWTQNHLIGGGRIIGEACHFIDLLRYLADSPIAGFDASALRSKEGGALGEDKAIITLRFEDGSLGTIIYLANGHKSFPKERLEVFTAGRILQLDNFRTLRGFGWPKFEKMKLWRQDKGQNACAAAFVKAIESGSASPIPFTELLEVSRATVDIAAALE
jgi:predicted dehydrogenase/threonine dehydrogenase-like Zn-dependent dehydrogenase